MIQIKFILNHTFDRVIGAKLNAWADDNEDFWASLVFTNNLCKVIQFLLSNRYTLFDIQAMQVNQLICIIFSIYLIKYLPSYFPVIFIFESEVLLVGHDVLYEALTISLTLLILHINLLIWLLIFIPKMIINFPQILPPALVDHLATFLDYILSPELGYSEWFSIDVIIHLPYNTLFPL